MKNKSLNSKLKLNKETIANLEQIKGGDDTKGPNTFLSICKSCIQSNCCQTFEHENTCIGCPTKVNSVCICG